VDVIAGAPAATGAVVAHYRAYIMGHDGHIWKAIDLVLKSDAEAIEAAKQLVDGHDVELWEQTRKVGIFKRKDGP